MLWTLNDLTIVGTWCYGVNVWPQVIAQIEAGRLPVESHHRPVGHRRGRKQVGKARIRKRRRHEGGGRGVAALAIHEEAS